MLNANGAISPCSRRSTMLWILPGTRTTFHLCQSGRPRKPTRRRIPLADCKYLCLFKTRAHDSAVLYSIRMASLRASWCSKLPVNNPVFCCDLHSRAIVLKQYLFMLIAVRSNGVIRWFKFRIMPCLFYLSVVVYKSIYSVEASILLVLIRISKYTLRGSIFLLKKN